MTKLLSALCAAVFVLAASGCGGDESEKLSAEDQKVADNISSYIVKQSQETWKKGEADCMARKFVTDVGVEDLEKAKLVTAKGSVNENPVKFDQNLADSFGDAYAECVDYAGLTGRQLSATRPDVDQKKFVECVRASVSKADSRARVVDMQMDKQDSDSITKTNEKLLKCAQDAGGTDPATPPQEPAPETPAE